jgi:hypothetical protein
MKRLRSLFGGRDEPRPGSPTEPAGEPSASELAEDEAARELRLQREFYTGLSEVARHELRFQDYAPEAPSQTNRSGRWVTSEVTDARDGTGRAVALDASTNLDYVGAQGDAESGLTFQFRTTDGGQVDIAAPDGEDWPPSVVRPSELGSPGDG